MMQNSCFSGYKYTSHQDDHTRMFCEKKLLIFISLTGGESRGHDSDLEMNLSSGRVGWKVDGASPMYWFIMAPY